MGQHGDDRLISRRRALQTAFCSSAALAVNVGRSRAQPPVDRAGLHLLALGDFGTGDERQTAVAGAMRTFRERAGIRLESLLLLGDNIYGGVPGGLAADSPRWRHVFEEMYPARDFDCPCYAVLGNHDYSDNAGGEQAQLAYARTPGTRWRMPAKWYRIDVGDGPGRLTILALDSNTVPQHLAAAEQREQQAWLEEQLAAPRGAFTLVMAHHPVFSNGAYGDTPHLVRDWAPLFERHKVHVFLSGHEHDLQHLELTDRFTSFVISGGGGHQPRDLPLHDRPAPFGRAAHGFTHLHVANDALAIAHYGVDGGLLHRFTKRADGGVRVEG